MKMRLLQNWQIGLCAALIPLVGGCVEDSTAKSPQAAPAATVLPASAGEPTAAPAVAEIPESAPPPERAEPAPGSEIKALPANLKLSPNAAEMVQLTQAGVNDEVMLAFITNTPGMFNLGADQIIYLNDLGVSSEVITAMIEHDRQLRGGNQFPASVTAPLPPPDAAAVAAAAAPQSLSAPMADTAAPPAPATTEAVAAPPANVTHNYFYDSLSPYGTWFEVEGYGRCWQPRVVVLQSGWRPYSDGGRWVYSDHGWYWHSDYSWGWAPFHYGRWFTHPRWGWCWRPDTVWGPAWVSWRYTDSYCGWAPLPPAAIYTPGFGFTYYGSSVGMSFGFGLGWSSYAFVSWTHFHDHRHYRHRIPHHQTRTIYERSTVVNNIVVGNNNTIINHGIGADRVRHFTKTDVRPVRVREVALADHDRRPPGDRLDRNNRELVVHRPRLPQTPASPSAPHRIAPSGAGRDTAAVNNPSANRVDADRDRAVRDNARPTGRNESAVRTDRSTPASSTPFDRRPRSAERERGDDRSSPRVDSPSGSPAAPVSRPPVESRPRSSEQNRSPERSSPRLNSSLVTPATPAPSVPAKLDTQPPKNEILPAGSRAWDGRREASSATSRPSVERSREMTTPPAPRTVESPARVITFPASRSIAAPSAPPAPVAPRVIEVPQSRTYTVTPSRPTSSGSAPASRPETRVMPSPAVRSEQRRSPPSAPAPTVRSEARVATPAAPPPSRAASPPSYSPSSSSRSDSTSSRPSGGAGHFGGGRNSRDR